MGKVFKVSCPKEKLEQLRFQRINNKEAKIVHMHTRPHQLTGNRAKVTGSKEKCSIV